MDSIQREFFMQRKNMIQLDLLPELNSNSLIDMRPNQELVMYMYRGWICGENIRSWPISVTRLTAAIVITLPSQAQIYAKRPACLIRYDEPIHLIPNGIHTSCIHP